MPEKDENRMPIVYVCVWVGGRARLVWVHVRVWMCVCGCAGVCVCACVRVTSTVWKHTAYVAKLGVQTNTFVLV